MSEIVSGYRSSGNNQKTGPKKVEYSKAHKEEPKKLRANRLFFKVLYLLRKNQCQTVVG